LPSTGATWVNLSQHEPHIQDRNTWREQVRHG
jgi:hypothetical protein